ncbi:MAG: TIGR03790 family protein [Planctomycetes bacterium]|nr:TIGR03790 family protein [Planctomycetota bacterium]
MTFEFQTMAGQSPVDPVPDQPLKLPRDLRNLQNRTNSLLQKASVAGESARKTVEALDATDPQRNQKYLRLYELNLQWDGLQGRYNHLNSVVKNIKEAEQLQAAQKQLGEMKSQILSLNDKIQKLDTKTASLYDQKERYQLILEGIGIKTLCRLLVSDRTRIDDLESYSSFDSELSLILWTPYSLTNWQLNHLRAWPSNLDKMFPDNTPSAQKQPIMMVARLDGPTHEIAQGLIDKAITAEKTPLSGTAYIDARGRRKANPDFGSYEFTDDSLRKTAQILRENTALKVVLDDKEALFPPNSCPDTTLYCGWYSLKNYIDSFKFNLGAVGFHIASFEAQTLRSGTPDSNIWCQRLLEKGITATLGPVNEPFLLSFPLADQFFADLTGGDYCLVECFYRTKPFNSWQFTLIGDPLYRPKFDK